MPTTPFADIAFLAIVGFVACSFVLAFAHSDDFAGRSYRIRRGAVIAFAWLGITALPTLTGIVSPTSSFPPQLFFGLVLATALAFALSGSGGKIAGTVPLWVLVGFQGLRLPLELVLHQWVEAGVAPPQMTWSGQNPDIVAGAVALAAIPLVRRRDAYAWLPTLLGMGLLLNIGRIVLTSLPGPMLRFPDPLTLPYRFPHVWIGTVCVAGALVAHVIAIRALLMKRR